MSPGLRTLAPSLSTAKTSLGLALSHSTVLSLGAASATGFVEVLLELRVNERLQDKTSEREKPREKIVKPDDRRRWTGKEMQRGPDICWTVIIRTARSSHILYCLLSCSERTLKRLHICFHTRGNEGTDIKHRPKHITPTLAVSPTSTRNSAVPIGYLIKKQNKAPLALGTLQKARIQNQFAVSPVSHRRQPSLALPSCCHARP